LLLDLFCRVLLLNLLLALLLLLPLLPLALVPWLALDLRLERDDFSSNRHLALAYWWSMIFSENRYPLFGIML